VTRIAVAATAPFGADVLERLAARHEIAYLLTQPDRPSGRGRRVAPPPAKLSAEKLGIPVRQPERLGGEFDSEVDTLVAVAYGQLVPRGALERARWLNVHPSLLPRWRGAAPVERALMAGDEETGVTIIELVEELDAGPIAAQEKFSVGIDDDAGAVFARAAELTPDLIGAALDNRRPAPRMRDSATYAEKIRPADRELDWSRPPEELHEAGFVLSRLTSGRAAWSRKAGDRLALAPRRRQAGLLEVQPEGRRRMTYDGFLRGLRWWSRGTRDAYGPCSRVFEQDAYADRAFEPRSRASTSATEHFARRLATGRSSACAPSTTRSSSSDAGRCASWTRRFGPRCGSGA
jgi:methionyl-tRNA formyltransferase